MSRNPDIDLDREPMPVDCYLHEGKLLQTTARKMKIPFGIGYRRVHGTGTRITVGLILRKVDRKRMLEGLERKSQLLAKRGGKW